MNTWTLFWFIAAIIMLWTFRKVIATLVILFVVGVLSIIAAVLGLIGFGSFAAIESVQEKLHRRKYRL